MSGAASDGVDVCFIAVKQRWQADAAAPVIRNLEATSRRPVSTRYHIVVDERRARALVQEYAASSGDHVSLVVANGSEAFLVAGDPSALRRLQTWCGEARVRPRRGLRIRVRVTARDAEYTARYTSPQALTLVYS